MSTEQCIARMRFGPEWVDPKDGDGCWWDFNTEVDQWWLFYVECSHMEPRIDVRGDMGVRRRFHPLHGSSHGPLDLDNAIRHAYQKWLEVDESHVLAVQLWETRND